jgi:hypothetical protein
VDAKNFTREHFARSGPDWNLEVDSALAGFIFGPVRIFLDIDFRGIGREDSA